MAETTLDRVLFAGGGTGGHVYMGVALARRLAEGHSQFRSLFVGTSKGLEQQIIPRLGLELETIEIGGLKRVGLRQTLATLFQLPGSLSGSLRILSRFGPRIVVGLGGYSSGPVVAAAWLKRIPTLAIEPNVVPGFTNRRLARIVSGAAVAYEESLRWFAGKGRVTGVPVRKEFFSVPDRSPFGSRLRLLIFGGSRGSHSINQFMKDAASALPADRVEVLHQTGSDDLESVREAYDRTELKAEVVAYIDDMPAAFANADLLVSRAGASTIAEITAAGKPAVLIPFPYAADDHQTQNALALERRGAARRVDERKATGADLAAAIASLEKNRQELVEMGKKARETARPHSTAKIVDFMEELTRGSKR